MFTLTAIFKVLAPSVGPVSIEEGYPSDEEARIYLTHEVPSSDDEDEEEDENEVISLWARYPRRRFCLPGCVCERARGRRCECEKVGDGFCDDRCGCDKEKCRTRSGEKDLEAVVDA